MWKKLAIVALIAWGGYQAWEGRSRHVSVDVSTDFPLSFSSALSLSAAPIQRPINTGGNRYRFGDYTITPLASFQVEAKVLSAKGYRLGREADLSPVDLALGWGPMADDAVLNQIEISQGGRWYRWRTAAFPIPRQRIESSSANMHLIPTSAEIASALHEADEGDVVRLLGYLVEVTSEDGWRWRSSLSRNDTGSGACELILVDKLLILDPARPG